MFTIVGPSGSGKTTLLRMLAGMETPTAGDIILRGTRINDIPANKRPTCMVFQSLALFPHKDVGDNIEFSLKIRGVDKAARKAKALELMRLLRLPDHYYGRAVTRISGGERQRVALARALAFDPEILFFDEPLSALDYKLKKTLEKELKDIHKESGKTFIYITHSLEEAMVMSDRIGVMREGRLAQVGSPNEIYTLPKTRFVSEFMGEVNSIAVVRGDDGRLHSDALKSSFAAPPAKPEHVGQGTLIIRPEDMAFTNGQTPPGANVIEGELFNEYLLGSRMQYQVRASGHTFLVEKLRATTPSVHPGDHVRITWRPEDSMLFGE
jgi:spermidine/putrescine transport system ATP-binding protein